MTSSSTMTPQLLTCREAATLCGLGERTLWRYSHNGTAPPPVKIGPGKQGSVRYKRSDLLTWIGAGCPRCEVVNA